MIVLLLCSFEVTSTGGGFLSFSVCLQKCRSLYLESQAKKVCPLKVFFFLNVTFISFNVSFNLF